MGTSDNPNNFSLNITDPDIPQRCITAIYASLRRNCIARIIKLLQSKYDLSFDDVPAKPMLLVVDFPIIKMSSKWEYVSQSIRLNQLNGFILRVEHQGLVYDVRANELTTDCLYYLAIHLENQKHTHLS